MEITIVQQLISEGIQPIEIAKNSKSPVLHAWNNPQHLMSQEEGAKLQAKLDAGECNLGVLCGKKTGIIAVDIDSNDVTNMRAVSDALGKPLYAKRGAKGLTLFYRYSGEVSRKLTFKNGNGFIDLLSSKPDGSSGRQTVIPPSIHPDTKEPYRWLADKGLYRDKLKPIKEGGFKKLVDDGIIEEYETLPEVITPTTYVAGIYANDPKGVESAKCILNLLDPVASRDDWRNIAYEFKHAVAGEEGRNIFLEWSNKTAVYAEHIDTTIKAVDDFFYSTPTSCVKQRTIKSLLRRVRPKFEELTEEAKNAYLYIKGKHTNQYTPVISTDDLDLDVEPKPEERFHAEEIARILINNYGDNLVFVTSPSKGGNEKPILYYLEPTTNKFVQVTRQGVSMPMMIIIQNVVKAVKNSQMLIDYCASQPDDKKLNRIKHRLSVNPFKVEVVSELYHAYFMGLIRSISITDVNNDKYHIMDSSGRLLDVRTGELVEYDIDKHGMITSRLPYEFNFSAGYASWEKFKTSILKNSEAPLVNMLEFFQQLEGSMITGSNKHRKVFAFTGAGANGKSTYLDACLKALSSSGGVNYSCKLDANTLVNRKFVTKNQTSRLLIPTVHRRLCVVSDTAGDVEWDTELIRDVTETSFTYTPLYGNATTAEGTATIIGTFNNLPKFTGKDTDKATGDRIVVVPFNTIFSEEERDRNLSEKLSTIEMRQQIFNSMLAGSIKLHKNKGEIYIPKELLSESISASVEKSNVLDIVKLCFDAVNVDDYDYGVSGVPKQDCTHSKDAKNHVINIAVKLHLPELMGLFKSTKSAGTILRNAGFIKKQFFNAGIWYLLKPRDAQDIIKDIERLGLLGGMSDSNEDEEIITSTVASSATEGFGW
jgi:hypothetical protein